MRDALIWVELGIAAFMAFYIFILLTTVAIILFSGWHDIWILNILFSFVPLALAVLTYVKIMQPVKSGMEPSKRWTSVLEISGYVFGLLIGGILLWVANKKVELARDDKKV